MAKQKNALVGVDFQNDFVLPSLAEAEKMYPGSDLIQGIHYGSLPVPGGVVAAENFTKFIKFFGKNLSMISFTHDSHDLHIATPVMWVDKDGNHPAPFTTITLKDVLDRKWRIAIPAEWAQKRGIEYLTHLKKEGRYVLTIWNPHCQIGTYGASLYKPVIEAAVEWRDKYIATLDHITKGSNPFTEHYSGMQAAHHDSSDPGTGLNKKFIKMLETSDFDNIYFGGLALNFCVRETMLDIIREFDSRNIEKIVLLTDCTSAIPDPPGSTLFKSFTDTFLKEATSKGMRIAKSTDLILT